MKLFISPHNDDETLFGSFTLLREKPLVVIVSDSWLQFNRNEPITADQRWEETSRAMKVLGCSAIRLGIRDDVIDEWAIEDKLKRFTNFEKVFIPALQGGNPHHDMVSRVAQKIFGDKIIKYMTYSATELYTTGSISVNPTPEELLLKDQALTCYESQINLPATAPHFEAVKGKEEWYE